MNKNIAIVCFSDFTKEPRVLRTLNALKQEYNISIYSKGNYTGNEFKFYQIDDLILEPLLPKFHIKWNPLFRKMVSFFVKYVLEKKYSEKAYFNNRALNSKKVKLIKNIDASNPSIVIGHGVETLPIITSEKITSKKIFNAHEYYVREFEENENWVKYTKPYYSFLINTFLEKVDLMFCVCETIQNEYLKEYRIDSKVITNARNYIDIKPLATTNSIIKLVHHGAAIKGRNIELTINVIDFLPDNYEMNLILMPTELDYYHSLKQKYGSNKRIHFFNSVEINELPIFLNQFDIGLYILPPTNYNNEAALPNKFFDFIQARLCLAISPNIEMKSLIEKHQLGIVSKNYTSEAMANEILTMDVDQINVYKNNAHKKAKELSGDVNEELILQSIQKLLQN